MENELISRQAATDAIIAKLDAIDHVPQWVFDELTGVIGDLPSVQPEPSQVARDIATIIENEKDMRVVLSQTEIIRCRDCAKCQYDALFEQYWCNGREVREEFYCADGERRTDD